MKNFTWLTWRLPAGQKILRGQRSPRRKM